MIYSYDKKILVGASADDVLTQMMRNNVFTQGSSLTGYKYGLVRRAKKYLELDLPYDSQEMLNSLESVGLIRRLD